MQDTESAAEGTESCLNYGSTMTREEAALGIAREVAETPRRQGLVTHWNGSCEKRIGARLDWKRRR
ncbi:MAG: hypothetical protein HYZ53_15840 [Planctomycetes bacterium]|nr:hypothetical protein [Planctomycetota bacterium]